MSSLYEPRAMEGARNRKQSMAELKLRRLQELVARLREDLERRRIPVSEAANDLINYTKKEPKDYMVPSLWGYPARGEDPYTPQQTGGCCSVM
ncbi:hypothetical protein BT63DRAFT_451757 [Microthyrium microscopicum]|uniref:Guanine nucleotide-binding protein subunit gamma n=1 Tax=Microthyrium microscopicum TaxID=703497 RepID=A0A6A6UQI4_9PEZI|nr:hypothetical protein BT63DRAFT_451757 [Microthyrium microscopicum]